MERMFSVNLEIMGGRCLETGRVAATKKGGAHLGAPPSIVFQDVLLRTVAGGPDYPRPRIV